MISLAHQYGRKGESWASTKNHIRSDFKNGRRLSSKQMGKLKRVHAGEVAPGGVLKLVKQNPLAVSSLEKTAAGSLTSVGTEKITADTRNGKLAGRIGNVDAESADHPSNLDPSHTDELRLWDTLEAIIGDTIGGTEIIDVMRSRGMQFDHNDFAIIRDVSDVALCFGNVSHHSEEYQRALSELVSRIRNSKV